jgi:hypothetical protein
MERQPLEEVLIYLTPFNAYSGNWSVDLQAGSTFGYKLLFVILMAGIGAACESFFSGDGRLQGG